MSRYPKTSHCIALLIFLLLEHRLFAATSACKSRILHLDGQYLRAESSDIAEISIAVYRDKLGRDILATHPNVIKRPKGRVVSIEIGSWKNDSCYVVMCIRQEEGIYRYEGIAFDYRSETGHLLLDKGKAGTLFYSRELYDTIHINPLSGDSISITFLATERREGGNFLIKSGVLLIHHCPIIPSPSFLYSLDGKLIFNEMEVMFKSANFMADPPVIPTSSGAKKPHLP